MSEVSFEPFDRQYEALEKLMDDTTNEVLYGGGARGGKTYLGCFWVMSQALEKPGSQWMIAREELTKLKDTTLITFFEVAVDLGMDLSQYYNGSDYTVRLPNGSIIFFRELKYTPSDPMFDRLGSYNLTGVFIDEAQQIHHQAINILRGRFSNLGSDKLGWSAIPKAFYSCNPGKGWIYSQFYKPYKNGELDKDKAFVKSLATDNPYVKQAYIDNLKKSDKVTVERLLKGNFDYDDNPRAIFNYDALIDVFSNTITKSVEKYLIVDIADDGTDKTVFSFWEGLEEYRSEAFERLNTETIVSKIREYASQDRIPFSQIAVDAIGVGAGVASSSMLDGIVGYKSSYGAIKTDSSPVVLPNVHYTKEAPLVSEYKNLRCQCVFKLAELVNNHKIASKTEGELKEFVIEELSTYQDTSKLDGKGMVTSKEDITDLLGRSPDNSDTWIMRMYFVIKEKMLPEQSEEAKRVLDVMDEQFTRNENRSVMNDTR